MSAVAAKDQVVSFHYTVRDDKQVVIDSSTTSGPLEYLHGYGQIIPGLESALAGKKVQDKIVVEVAPVDAYGEYNDQLVVQAQRGQFPKGAKIEVGEMFEFAGPEGEPVLVRIGAVVGDAITLDANHPLAGKTLFFEAEVVGIRAATKEEIEHGHVHGAGYDH